MFQFLIGRVKTTKDIITKASPFQYIFKFFPNFFVKKTESPFVKRFLSSVDLPGFFPYPTSTGKNLKKFVFLFFVLPVNFTLNIFLRSESIDDHRIFFIGFN